MNGTIRDSKSLMAILIFAILWVGMNVEALGQESPHEEDSGPRPGEHSPENQGKKGEWGPGNDQKEGPDGRWEPESSVNESASQRRAKAAPGTSSMQSRTLSTLYTRGLGFIVVILLVFIGWKSRTRWNVVTFGKFAALFACAFAIRWIWPDHTVFHENHHGYDYLRSIHQGLGQTYGFASSYIILMNILTSFTSPIDDGVFLWNTVFSSLQVPLLALTIHRISGNQWAGWTAGFMWAMTPHAIRLAPTETYFNFITCLLFGSVLTVTIAMEKVRQWDSKSEAWAWTILGLILVILEAKARVLTLGYPLVILLMAIGMGAGKSAREKWALMLGSMVITFSLVGQILDVLERAKHSPQGRSLVDLSNVVTYGQDFVFFDPAVVSSFLLPLAFLGVIQLLYEGWKNRTPRVLFTLAGVSMVVLIAGSVHGTFPSRVRFELPVNAVLTGLAACGGLGLGRLVLKLVPTPAFLHQPAAKAVIGLALAGTAMMPHDWVKRPMHEQVSYDFLRQEVIPEIQSRGEIVVLVPDAPAPTGTIPVHWWAEHTPNAQITRTADPNKADLLYLGLECFWTAPGWSEGYPYNQPYPVAFEADGIPFSVHPVCAKSLGSSRWNPLHLREIGRAIPNPCVDLKPTVKSVQFGLFERVK